MTPPHSLNDEYYSKFFDSVANSGFNGFLFNFTHRILEKKSPVSKRILEVGAGKGQHIKFVNLGYEVYVASDLNPKMALSGEKYPNVVFEHFDVSQIPYPEVFFDRVISTCLLHHVSDVEIALKEMKRVTRSGGRISLYVSCDPGLLNRILRRVLVIPKARKLGFFDYPLLISREHRNHFQSIDTLIEYVFKNSIVKKMYYPSRIHSWNLNLFAVYQITV
jgi:SAM-dependent methyltransferase